MMTYRKNNLIYLLWIILLFPSLVFSQEISPPTFLLEWSGHCSNTGEFDSPRDVAVDKLDNIYVSDHQNHTVQKFDSNWKYFTKWGSIRKEKGPFGTPSKVKLNKFGNIYIVVFFGNRIPKFAA